MRKLFLVLLSILILFGFLAAQEPVPAPPNTFIDTTWAPPSGGTTWHSHSSSDLQGIINGAAPGDIIILDSGVTFTGNYTLPLKSNPSNKWIYIWPSGLANLPPPGTRIDPSNAPNMARMVTPNASPVFTLAPGANYYRIVGLEVTSLSTQGCNPTLTPPQNCYTFFLIGWQSNTTQLPDHIFVDRSYVHGSPTQDVRQGVQLNVTYGAVIDSYISDIHQSTADSQAILAYWTPGPLKVVDNFLSATTEDTLFGGAGGYANPYIPSDIEIRNNHFWKDIGWDKCGAGGTLTGGQLQRNGVPCPTGLGYQWVEKNNLEFKSAQRVVATGNTLEHTWLSSQVGYSLLFTMRTSQSGNIAVVNDIDFENNILTDVDAGVDTLEQDNLCGAAFGYPNCTNKGQSKRIRVANNLFLLSPIKDTTQHTWLKVDGGNASDIGLTDYVFQHNTALMLDGSNIWNFVFSLNGSGCPPNEPSSSHNVWMLDNALGRQPIGDCGYLGLPNLSYYMSDPSPLATRYLGNVMFKAADATGTWPAQNDVAAAWTFDTNYNLLTPNWSANTSDGKQAGWSSSGTGVMTITTSTLPGGALNAAYPNTTLAENGGVAPITWAVIAGTLPHGLALSSGGVISGTPTQSGNFSFTIQATDSTTPTHLTATAQLSISVSGGTSNLKIITTSLPAGQVNASYSAQLSASGGAVPPIASQQRYFWSVVGGMLPVGTALSSSGAITGAPTSQGTFLPKFQVTDLDNNTSAPVVLPIVVSIQSGSGCPVL